MGVHGLWPLLEPVGRRVNIEALTNKRLAVDASIWVHQFIKTMRAADGEVLRNAHLLGFFRRICKLLFNHIRPVFVFDGGTPALKKRTTIARRRQREAQGAKLRKAAEKLLLAHLKKRALDTLQAEQALEAAKSPPNKRSRKALPGPESQEEAKAMQISPEAVAAEAERMLQQGATLPELPEGADEGAEDIVASLEELEDMDEGELDEAELHMQQAIEASMSGEPVNPTVHEEMFGTGHARPAASKGSGRRPRRQKERQKSRFYQESKTPPPRPSAPPATAPADIQPAEEDMNGEVKDEEEEEEEEDIDEADLILAASSVENIDPAIMANLPPSVQLDLMAKLREQKTYLNREGFQQRQAQPMNFSQFQMDEYLKASAIRKQMDGIKDVMNAAVSSEGTTSKRIAGDAGREYVLHKDAVTPPDRKTSSGGLQLVKSETGGSGGLISLGSGALGKPPLPPNRSNHLTLASKGSVGILPSSRELSLPSVESSASGSGLQIALDLEDVAEDDGDDEEWEDVDHLKTSGSQEQDKTVNMMPTDIDLTKKPSHWRERMQQRQKFWSHSTGFKFGRKLADWGKDGSQEHGEESAKLGTTPEDEEVQRAIALSLEDLGGQKAVDGGDSDDWDDVDVFEQQNGQPSSTQKDQGPVDMPSSYGNGLEATNTAPSQAKAARQPKTANNEGIPIKDQQSTDIPTAYNKASGPEDQTIKAEAMPGDQKNSNIPASHNIASGLKEGTLDTPVKSAQGKAGSQSSGMCAQPAGGAGESAGPGSGKIQIETATGAVAEVQPWKLGDVDKISPFKAEAAQKDAMPRASKEQEKQSPRQSKARRKIVLPAAPQSKKASPNKAMEKRPPTAGQRQAASTVEVLQSRLEHSGAEPSHQPAATTGQQSSITVSLPSARAESENFNPPSPGREEVETGKAVQSNGQLRAFANPDQIPEVKDETPHTEPAGRSQVLQLKREEEASPEAVFANGGQEGMEQLKGQATAASESPGYPQSNLKYTDTALAIPSIVQAERTRQSTEHSLTTRRSVPSEAGEDHESNGGSQIQERPKPVAQPKELDSEEALREDLETPLAQGNSNLHTQLQKVSGPTAKSARETLISPASEPPTSATPASLAGVTARDQPKSLGRPRGLRPIPDSTILDPDPEASRAPGNSSGLGSATGQQTAGVPRGLRPIPDSTILDPDLSGNEGRRDSSQMEPGPLDGADAEVMDSLDDHFGMSLGGSDRLDSDFLNPMPSDLAAQIEAHKNPDGELVSVPSDLAKQIEEHRKETKRLAKEHRKQAGISDTPTSGMYGECQELLQMFGLPYIIAPVEAEAQCAWLDDNGLVDGVVTDDNDVFLFGGQHVYRHIFADKLYVEEYRASDFQSEIGLDRQKLIYLALLLGSDYTEGISGIGIVNAVEIVNAFEGKDGLKAFKEWVNTPDKDILEEAQRVTKRGRGKKKEEPEEIPQETNKEAETNPAMSKFKKEHRGARKSWDLPHDFPNWRVITAYTEAKVDTNREQVTFARPDLEHLRLFCNEKFGWPFNKTDELMVPVLKEDTIVFGLTEAARLWLGVNNILPMQAFDEKHTQSTMDSFLNFSQRFAKIKSKRLQKAVSAIRGTRNEEILMADAEDEAPPKKKGRKRKAPDAPNQEAGVLDEDEDLALDPADLELLDVILASPPKKDSEDQEPKSAGRRGGRGRGRGRGRWSKSGPSKQKDKAKGAEEPRAGRGRGMGRWRGRAKAKQAKDSEDEVDISSGSDTDPDDMAPSKARTRKAASQPRQGVPQEAEQQHTAEASEEPAKVSSEQAQAAAGEDDSDWEDIAA